MAILALAIGGFGIGVTEFVVMGIMPQIAEGIGGTEADVGHGISAYALGVVVGAPVITALAAKVGRKRLLLAIIVLFIVGNGLTIFATEVPTFLASRFLSGLPHGVYFGVASVTAASMADPDRRGRTIAKIFLGLTIANLAGVPAATWLGQAFGWQTAFMIVVLIGVINLLAVLIWVPAGPVRSDASITRELTALKSGQLWLGLMIGAIGFAGIFAVYSYITPIVTGVSGVPEALVPLIMALFGLGMTVGTMFGGRLADWSVDRSIIIALIAMAVVLGLFGAFVHITWVAYVGAFVLGVCSQLLGPPVQIRLMDSAPQAPSLAASMHHAAFNMANAMGAAAGGFFIARQMLVAPAWAGVGFALAGLLVAVLTMLVPRKRIFRRRYQVDTTTGSIAIVPMD
ncbi:MAG: MFS transporter [Mycetocola reblochoni]|uniref:MFS permease n=2 Tax=Mycetocola reblochoni TaxID=331618 RepID=A0A1R4JVN0_9MICO|nr:MFS transporter [Mycetocola reblochoni]SJN35895.1 MFS permease [Mycetocola reblochoni REB411]